MRIAALPTQVCKQKLGTVCSSRVFVVLQSFALTMCDLLSKPISERCFKLQKYS